MKYIVEMGSGVMMYIPSFIMIGGKWIGEESDTQTAWCLHKTTFIFLNKESRLINRKEDNGRWAQEKVNR
jgi:hypothetical protein